ncbi:hypothetical protein [Streptomyces sp. NPDC012510]|uniref:hypothetical protein n=1 Tax=Streptomyces sp. NPDC012510 TaxID=3364838 RepID=UPI0036E60098
MVAWRTGLDVPGHPADGPHFAVVALAAGAMGVRNITTLRARVADVGAWLHHEGVRPAAVLLIPAVLVLLLGTAFWREGPPDREAGAAHVGAGLSRRPRPGGARV